MPTTKEIARSASSLAEELYCRRNELSDCEWRLMAEAWITGYAQSEIVRLAEEAGQEARAIRETAGRNIPNAPFGSAYDAATRGAQHLEFAADWIRSKVKE